MLAKRSHGFGEPEPGPDQQQHDHEGGGVHLHAVAIIVGIVAALELGEVGDRRRRLRWRSAASAREQQHARFSVGGSITRHFRHYSTPCAGVRWRPTPRNLNWTPLISASRLAAMKQPMRPRRAVALIAAYLVALQALLLPLAVAAGGPVPTSLCSEASTSAPARHDTGCPCAAGCGTQCCAQSLLGPPQIGVAVRRSGTIAVTLPVTFVSVVRVAHRSAHGPRAPPAG